MTKTVARQKIEKIEKIENKTKLKSMDFTLCITVLLLLALRDCYGVISKFSICISRVTEIVMPIFLFIQYLQ